MHPTFEHAVKLGIPTLRPKANKASVDDSKYLVVDAREAIFGGMNLADAVASNHDMMVHVAGPVARELQSAFSESWEAAVDTHGPDPRDLTLRRAVFQRRALWRTSGAEWQVCDGTGRVLTPTDWEAATGDEGPRLRSKSGGTPIGGLGLQISGTALILLGAAALANLQDTGRMERGGEMFQAADENNGAGGRDVPSRL